MAVAAEAEAGRVAPAGRGGSTAHRRGGEPGPRGEGGGGHRRLPRPVSYTPLTEEEDSSTSPPSRRRAGCPSSSTTTGDHPFPLHPGLIGRLAGLPGVVAAKCPGPAPAVAALTVAELRGAVPRGVPPRLQRRLERTEALMRASAWYGVAAGLFPRPCLEIVRAVEAGMPTGVAPSTRRWRPSGTCSSPFEPADRLRARRGSGPRPSGAAPPDPAPAGAGADAGPGHGAGDGAA